MVLWYFLVILAIVALLFASIVDIKTLEVPDWLSYSLIVVGLGIRLIYSLISYDFSYILYGFLGFAVFFTFANFMYYTKQWGGGDSKLLMGLGAMFGNYEGLSILDVNYRLPFLVVLLINIFISGTIYGMIYSVFLGMKNKRNFVKEFKKRNFTGLKIISSLIVILIGISILVFGRPFLYIPLTFLLAILLAYVILFFMRIIEDSAMYKMINVNKLTEGDWLVKDVIVKNKLICRSRNIGLTKEDIKLLKKRKVKMVLVKEGIPFVPGFLIGFLVTIFLGDLLFLFI